MLVESAGAVRHDRDNGSASIGDMLDIRHCGENNPKSFGSSDDNCLNDGRLLSEDSMLAMPHEGRDFDHVGSSGLMTTINGWGVIRMI